MKGGPIVCEGINDPAVKKFCLQLLTALEEDEILKDPFAPITPRIHVLVQVLARTREAHDAQQLHASISRLRLKVLNSYITYPDPSWRQEALLWYDTLLGELEALRRPTRKLSPI